MADGLTAARAADVETPVALVNAVYEVLSGPAAKPRDWNRFRTLYAPSAILMPVRVDRGGAVVIDCFNVESFITSRTPILAAADFYETEVKRAEFRFGHLAHVASHYESRRAPDAAPFSAGINSIQLFFDARRWWILSVAWDVSGGGAPRAG